MAVLVTIDSVPTMRHVDPDVKVRLARVYRTAAKKISEAGWIQGQGKTSQGICVQVALFEALIAHGEPTRLMTFEGPPSCVMNLTGDEFAIYAMQTFARFVGTYSIPAWNDSPIRTREEVIKSLRACADELAPEHDRPDPGISFGVARWALTDTIAPGWLPV